MAFEIQFKHSIEVQTFHQFFESISQLSSLFGFKLVCWKASSIEVLTLNTGGRSKRNPRVSGGGGILRDSNGCLLVAFSIFLGGNTSLRVEALALLTSLRLYS